MLFGSFKELLNLLTSNKLYKLLSYINLSITICIYIITLYVYTYEYTYVYIQLLFF